jgi:hypothetical protein
MAKLSYDEFKKMLMNPDVPDSEIARYVTARPADSGPFDPSIVPDPAKVDMTVEGEFDVESAIRWGNAVSRWRREQRFLRKVHGTSQRILVSEGDSWFQFPFLIEDVIDHLGDDFLIWSLDAAGDTSDNMVNRAPEYRAALDRWKTRNVAGFLFSAAGNDVIGEDLLGVPVLGRLLKPFDPSKDAAGHIDQGQLATILTRLEADYRKVIATVRLGGDFTNLPIFIHGYDYAIPGGFPGDTRDPIYAAQDEWLGGPMKLKGIVDPTLQRAIVRLLIDALYYMLYRVASSDPRIFVVEVRGTLKDGDWADEIHATSTAFKRVAAHFKAAINAAI